MKIIYYVTSILLIVSGMMGGLNVVFNQEAFLERLTALEYPPYLGYILAFFQVLGGIVIALNLFKINLGKAEFLKEWAYAGFFILFTGAVLTHVFTDGEFIPALIALIIFEVAYFSKIKFDKLTKK